MRRQRPGLNTGMTRVASPQASQLLASPPPLPASPTEPLDWERIVGPSCCVCGQVYEREPVGDKTNTIDTNGGNTRGPSSRQGGGGGGPVGEESFVVLPDSKPVLSEDYFTLSRNHNHRSFGSAPPSSTSGVGDSAITGDSTNLRTDTNMIPKSGLGISGDGGLGGGGTSSLAPGSELLESRYSGFGGSAAGFGGGWTASGFGGGSSMLDSIVQISHAGLSDNVRRESLLYELSKQPARRPSSTSEVGGQGGRGGEGEDTEEDHDPTLCCHCYASLLEQIDEDSRVVDREALAYRDFVDLLDGVSAEGGLEGSDNSKDTTIPANPDGPNKQRSRGSGITRTNSQKGSSEGGRADNDAVDDVAQEKSARDTNTRAAGGEPCGTTEERCPSGEGSPLTPSSRSLKDAQQQQQQQQQQQEEAEEEGGVGGDEEGEAGKGAAEPSPPSAFSQALRIAEQTSEQLRAELRSLERQRTGLCARGSEAWAALSELAYARDVLGEECRELLRSSREVAESAACLSERSALSDLFSIRHVDGFPSINGYRLGKSPDDKRRLHWDEINAAWGEAVLLVRCVSSAVDFHSLRFRLVPLNCASRVIELASGDNGGGLKQERRGEDRERRRPPPTSGVSCSSSTSADTASATGGSAPVATSVVVVCAHDLFSNGGGIGGIGGIGGGRGSDEKQRYLAAIRAFLACTTEVISFLERRVLERRLEGEMSAGAACVAWSDAGAPFNQTEDAVGGVSIGALKSRAAWKAWLCQLVKNLEWAVTAASSLCVA